MWMAEKVRKKLELTPKKGQSIIKKSLYGVIIEGLGTKPPPEKFLAMPSAFSKTIVRIFTKNG